MKTRGADYTPAYIYATVYREMKLPAAAHTSQGWRIDEIIPDFRLEDVWALPAHGGPNDLPFLIDGFATANPAQVLPLAGRALWNIRFKLGALLGWDEPDTGLGARVPSLRRRLPPDLLEAPGPDFDTLPFTSLYQLENEFAAEIANRTMHGVMHLSWVADGTGDYHGQMAVFVKPNGLLGSAYMAAIKPFRYLIVYPQMMREIERRSRERSDKH